MAIKKNIKFGLNARNGKVENLPIRMRITFNRERFDFPIGFNIDASQWNNRTELVKDSAVNKQGHTASTINKTIADYRSNAERLFTRYDLDEIEPTVEQVKDALTYLFSKKAKIQTETAVTKPKKLLERFDEFVAEVGRSNNWTEATFEKFRSVRNHIKDFDAELGVDDFDNDKITDYLYFLQEQKQMRNSTLKKQLGFLKWYLRWADAKGYSTQRAYFSFTYKPKAKENKRVIFLDWDELMHLNELTIPATKQYLERVRDVFCFCCFTSLRYSDVYNLRRSDVKRDTIEVTTIKTSDRLVIDLNKYSRAIIDKYKDIPFPDDKALPVISNQKMNDYLKELGKLAGFDEPIREVYFVGNERKEVVVPKYELLGTHAGRRTFICNALAMGIPAQVVMKWTGHSDYKAMKPYIDVADTIKKTAMSKFDER